MLKKIALKLSTITDCLKVPMAKNDLNETIHRNFQPEIRHELLNVTIDSV